MNLFIQCENHIMTNEYNLIPYENQLMISNDFSKISNLLNTTGLYKFLKENDLYQNSKKEFSSMVTGFIENGINKDFHQNLNFFEKIGFLSESKFTKHQQKVGFYKGLTSFTVESTLSLAPAIVDYFYKKEKFTNLKEFVIGGLSFINRENSILIQNKSEVFYRLLGEKFKYSEYENLFNKYINQNIRVFPYLNKSNESEKYKLFNFIISVSDLNNLSVKSRSEEFGEYLGLNTNEIIMALENVKESSDYISDIAKISSGITLTDIFRDISESFSHSKQYSLYSLENAPYSKKRIETREIINNTIKNSLPIVLTSLGTFNTINNISSLIEISSPIVSNILNSEINIKKEIKIQKGFEVLLSKYI